MALKVSKDQIRCNVDKMPENFLETPENTFKTLNSATYDRIKSSNTFKIHKRNAASGVMSKRVLKCHHINFFHIFNALNNDQNTYKFINSSVQKQMIQLIDRG